MPNEDLTIDMSVFCKLSWKQLKEHPVQYVHNFNEYNITWILLRFVEIEGIHSSANEDLYQVNQYNVSSWPLRHDAAAKLL